MTNNEKYLGGDERPQGSQEPSPVQGNQLSHAAVLRDRAKRLAMGYTERFEADAEQFYRDTGFIAPGKSVPLEMAAEQADSLRDNGWREWVERQSRMFAAALMAGADAIETLDALGPDAN